MTPAPTPSPVDGGAAGDVSSVVRSLEHYLANGVELRSNDTRSYQTDKTSGFTVVVVPEWQLRQWLTALTMGPMQHVAYYDEGAFHWMSGIAPRDCELFAARVQP